MKERILYAFRGWIAFVAFMDIGTAFRCYVEKRSFFAQTSEVENIEADYTISRLIGMYCILKAVTLIHCTLFIHHKPIVIIGRFSIILTIVMYSTEALYFGSTTINFYLMFPLSLNYMSYSVSQSHCYKSNGTIISQNNFNCHKFGSVITLIGLFYVPLRLRLWDPLKTREDENNQIIKQIATIKRRKTQKLC